jgi:hypothetical protein
MGKTYKDNPHKYRKHSDSNKPRKNKEKRDERWKPMGGSAQPFLVGDNTSFHD